MRRSPPSPLKSGRATGVVLSDGEEIQAARVVSNADPKRTFLTLLDPPFCRSVSRPPVRAYRCEGASMKINLAVAGLPPSAAPKAAACNRHGGLIQFTKPLTELDNDQDSARRGIPAENAHAEICIPTVHDPSLAPAGQHVVTIGVRSQPYRLSESSRTISGDVADRVISHLGEFLPNLPGAVLHREILTPLDLGMRLALTGHFHGDMAPDQLLFLRPVRGFADYRTPVDGLYLCGSQAPIPAAGLRRRQRPEQRARSAARRQEAADLRQRAQVPNPSIPPEESCPIRTRSLVSSTKSSPRLPPTPMPRRSFPGGRSPLSPSTASSA